MGVVVEAVRLVARLDVATGLHAVDGHVHEAELGVVVDLLLSVEHHGVDRVSAVVANVVRRAHEHAARAARGVEHGSAVGLDDAHDHTHQGLRGEEHAVVGCYSRGELAQEVLVDAPDDVIAFLVELLLVENSDDLAKELVPQIGIVVGQDAR